MIKNMMQQTKRHLAMFLAAAVVVTGLPVMTADAAVVQYKNGDEVVNTVSANSKEEADRYSVSGNGCQEFKGWKYSVSENEWSSLSDNDVVSAEAIFEERHTEATEGEITKEPTCTEEGEKVFKCEDCGKVLRTEKIEKVDHEIEEKTTAATCTEDGKIEYVCKNCEQSVSENTVIPAKGHGATKTTTTAATCGKDGKIEYTCEVCGKSVSDNTVLPKTGEHKWDAGKVTKAPTTQAEGVKTFTCSVCGETKTEAIPKTKPSEEKPVTPTVKLNVKKITLQVKKSTTAVVASGMVKGDKVASWTSSNKKIVTVSKSGKITAKKVGKATITVKTKLGAKATLQVTVQKKAVKLKKISVNKTKVTLKKGKTFKIVATKSPITAQDKVTFKTNNKKVATVSSKGVVKAKKPGKATITVKAGKKTKRVTVTVKK